MRKLDSLSAFDSKEGCFLSETSMVISEMSWRVDSFSVGQGVEDLRRSENIRSFGKLWEVLLCVGKTLVRFGSGNGP